MYPRTTNPVEGWNHAINQRIAATHPSLQMLIQRLREQEQLSSSRRIRLERGHPAKARQARYLLLDAQIQQEKQNLTVDLENLAAQGAAAAVVHQRVRRFCRRCAYLTGGHGLADPDDVPDEDDDAVALPAAVAGQQVAAEMQPVGPPPEQPAVPQPEQPLPAPAIPPPPIIDLPPPVVPLPAIPPPIFAPPIVVRLPIQHPPIIRVQVICSKLIKKNLAASKSERSSSAGGSCADRCPSAYSARARHSRAGYL